MNCKEGKVSILFLIAACFFLTAASPNISDKAKIINHQNAEIVSGENRYYQTTKEKPRLVLSSQQGLKRMQPQRLNQSKRTVYIVVGQEKQKRSVQIFSSRDLHSAFTRTMRLNMIANKRKKLNSKNNKEFNQGLQFVIRACITQINQHYGFTSKVNTLTLREQMQLNHPRRLLIAIILGFLLVLTVFVFFYHKWRKPIHSKDLD